MTNIEKLIFKEKIIDGIRRFFKERNFHEMFTPTMVKVPSCEPNLEPFKVEDKYLIMSPEYSLKKIMALGFENIFEIAKVFRNKEQESSWHKPEFMMLEWYRKNVDYKKIMTDFEELFISLNVNETLMYQGDKYDLKRPWPRFSVSELFSHACRQAGSRVPEVEDEFFYKFLNEIEPKLRDSGKPAIVYDWPANMASLSRKKPEDPRFAERFEVYLAGVELCNAFSELTDPAEQRQRFEEEMALRQAQGKLVYPIDEELLEALGQVESMAGNAVGVDRLIMLLGDFEAV